MEACLRMIPVVSLNLSNGLLCTVKWNWFVRNDLLGSGRAYSTN
jgi:hypothetical protein